MILQIEIRELRKLLKEKCGEIIRDEKIADMLYCRMCEIEDDERFIVVKDQLSSIYGVQGGSNNGKTV